MRTQGGSILSRRRRPSERTMFAAGRRMHTRCAWCRTRVSRGRAEWSRDQYRVVLCERCETTYSERGGRYVH